MAIVAMQRFTLITFHRHKENILKQMQKLGEIHFKCPPKDAVSGLDFLRPDFTDEKTARYQAELEKVRFALAKIAPHAQRPKGLKALTQKPFSLDFEEFDQYLQSYDYSTVYEKVKHIDEQADRIDAQIARLTAENEGIKAWLGLDVAPAEFHALQCVRVLLGTVHKTAAAAFNAELAARFDMVYAETLGTTRNAVSMLLILPADTFKELLAELKTLGFDHADTVFEEIPAEETARNLEKISALQKEKQAVLQQVALLVPEYEKLLVVSDYFKAALAREQARENFVSTGNCVLIEGWLPADQSARLKKILTKVSRNEFYIAFEEVGKDSLEVPVKLKNNGFVAAFQDITETFAAPKYGEIDPTPLLTPFYWIFFGFMVADVGFGLVLLAGTLIALQFSNLKAGMRNFVKLFFYLSFAVILAGCVYGSFFGFTFFAPIAVRNDVGEIIRYKPILDTQTDISLMLLLSIGLGLLQVLSGLIIKGYLLVRDGKILDAVFDSLFWIVTLVGGVAWLGGVAGILPPPSSNLGKWSFILGMLGLLLTQGRESKSIGGKIGTTLWNVYGITGYAGDLISYTRIVALGLSGAYIAFSFIKIASILPKGPIGAIFGFIIIFLGETLDFGLGLLGAYVHTCRLQYVEFFGKFYEGGGVVFKPLQCKNDYVRIIELQEEKR